MCERKNPECRYCHGNGRIELKGCPHKDLTDDLWELLDAADLVAKGWHPDERGWKNQPAAFVDGVLRVWSEIERAKAELTRRR